MYYTSVSSDLHHVIIRSYQLSYIVFPIGDLILYDFADQFMESKRVVGVGFDYGCAICGYGCYDYVGMVGNPYDALLPVFFVATSVSIGIGISLWGKSPLLFWNYLLTSSRLGLERL